MTLVFQSMSLHLDCSYQPSFIYISKLVFCHFPFFHLLAFYIILYNFDFQNSFRFVFLIQSQVHAKLLQSCLTLCSPQDCSLPDSSLRGIFQARMLGQVAMPSSRGSCKPKDQSCVSPASCIGRRVLHDWCHLGCILVLLLLLFFFLFSFLSFSLCYYNSYSLSYAIQCVLVGYLLYSIGSQRAGHD